MRRICQFFVKYTFKNRLVNKNELQIVVKTGAIKPELILIKNRKLKRRDYHKSCCEIWRNKHQDAERVEKTHTINY